MSSTVQTTIREHVAVIGLGYVGLPVALAFARRIPGTVGFDVNTRRIEELRRFVDKNGEVRLRHAGTASEEELARAIESVL